MADEKKTSSLDSGDHSIEGNTDVPDGLDVVPTVPGTVIGAHDLQGTDGETRTDRPGEILGTPVAREDRTDARERETRRSNYVASEVDRANREELPRLGGAIDDGWVEGDATTEAATTSTRSATTRTTESPAVPSAATTGRTAAPATSPRANQLDVKPTIERG